jgi:hypothetical protein
MFTIDDGDFGITGMFGPNVNALTHEVVIDNIEYSDFSPTQRMATIRLFRVGGVEIIVPQFTTIDGTWSYSEEGGSNEASATESLARSINVGAIASMTTSVSLDDWVDGEDKWLYCAGMSDGTDDNKILVGWYETGTGFYSIMRLNYTIGGVSYSQIMENAITGNTIVKIDCEIVVTGSAVSITGTAYEPNGTGHYFDGLDHNAYNTGVQYYAEMPQSQCAATYDYVRTT